MVVAASKPSQEIWNSAIWIKSSAGKAGDMAMTMETVTVCPTAMAVLVEEKEGVGEGVPPGAVLVVEGLGVLLEEGRLVMDSEG